MTPTRVTIKPKREICSCCAWMKEEDTKRKRKKIHEVLEIIILPVTTKIKGEAFLGCTHCDGGLVKKVLKLHGS